MPGRLFDGIDPIATYAAVNEAMDRARTGGGPTLVEAKCYRYSAHSTDDDDLTYRTATKIEEQRKHDPVPRVRTRLLDRAGIIDDGGRRRDAQRRAPRNERGDRRGRGAALSRHASDLYTNVYEGAWQPWQS